MPRMWMRDSVMVISKFNKLRKYKEPIPVNDVTTSIADPKQNNMTPIPIEQQYQIYILEELKAIHNLLKERL